MWVQKVPRSKKYHVFFHDNDGKLIQRTTGKEAYRAAKEAGKQIADEHLKDHKKRGAGAETTTSDVASLYVDSELSKRKWHKTAERWIDAIVDHLGEDHHYCDVSTVDVAEFLDTIDPSYSPATINRVIAIWRRMHNYTGKVRELPVKMIRWKELQRDEDNGRTRHLSKTEVPHLLNSLDQNIAEIVLFAIMTGARKAQCKAITWDRVDFESQTVRVFLKSRKKYVEHTIDMHPALLKLLLLRRERAVGEYVFDTTNFEKRWRAGLKKAEITDFVFHDLRHTAASLLLEEGASLVAVQKVLGHASIVTTQRYGHLQRAKLREEIHRLPSFEVPKLPPAKRDDESA